MGSELLTLVTFLAANEHITNASKSSDIPRALKIISEFLTQRRNMDVDRTIKHVIFTTGDLIEDLVAIQHSARTAKQTVQKIEF